MSNPSKFKANFGKLARTLGRLGLPALGTALGGPAGGIIASTIGGLLGTDPKDETALEKALAAAPPEILVQIREIESRIALAELETDRAQLDAVQSQWLSDNATGHWLPTNARPLVMLSLLVFYMAWTAATGVIVVYFFARAETLDDSLTGFFITTGLQLTGFLTTVTLAYFGARSYDKKIGTDS